MKQTKLYSAHTMPGLERIAWQEIHRLAPDAELETYKTIPGKNGLVLFNYAGPVEPLLELRTVEDVFLIINRIPHVAWGYEGLDQIFKQVLMDKTYKQVMNQIGEQRKDRKDTFKTFRIIVRIAGKNQPYRRVDMQRSLDKALKRNLGKSWQSVEDGGRVEVWANLIGMDFLLGIRLSDASMRQRDYKQQQIEASLRPSVAAAMVFLSQPKPDDVFVDPMCGAGTIILERALIERHTLLIAGDSSPESISATRENIGRKHKPREILLWDARQLPLETASVDRIVTNLPFGRKVAAGTDLEALYTQALNEFSRVLRPGGRAVLLTAAFKLFRQVIKDVPGLYIQREQSMTLLGLSATIFVLDRYDV